METFAPFLHPDMMLNLFASACLESIFSMFVVWISCGQPIAIFVSALWQIRG
jgi:hypothetical protein